MNNNDIRSSLDREERIVADRVADEILEEPKKNRKVFLVLLLLLLFGLSFLVSSVSFAVLGSKFESNNVITSGSILFSYEEKTRGISILNAYPIHDEDGKKLSKDQEYFKFDVSYSLESKKTAEGLHYQISLIPDSNNTLDDRYVRVYLLEDEKEVSLSEKMVRSFSELENSSLRNGAKLLLDREVSETFVHHYTLRLWVSKDYVVTNQSEIFRCYVAIDTY